MTPPADSDCYKHHRFPGEIISHGVGLYYRFTLSDRDVEERWNVVCFRMSISLVAASGLDGLLSVIVIAGIVSEVLAKPGPLTICYIPPDGRGHMKNLTVAEEVAR